MCWYAMCTREQEAWESQLPGGLASGTYAAYHNYYRFSDWFVSSFVKWCLGEGEGGLSLPKALYNHVGCK